jgi:hypothetical protein
VGRALDRRSLGDVLHVDTLQTHPHAWPVA